MPEGAKIICDDPDNDGGPCHFAEIGDELYLIRGYPIQFDLDLLILFSANPSTYNRSGKVIPQLKDRIGTIVQTHYPSERDEGIEIMRQEVGDELGGLVFFAQKYTGAQDLRLTYASLTNGRANKLDRADDLLA